MKKKLYNIVVVFVRAVYDPVLKKTYTKTTTKHYMSYNSDFKQFIETDKLKYKRKGYTPCKGKTTFYLYVESASLIRVDGFKFGLDGIFPQVFSFCLKKRLYLL